MRALAVLAALAQLAGAAQLHVRVARVPHEVRAAGSAANAANASFAVVGACPALRTLTASCVDQATLGTAAGVAACVVGPDGIQKTSAANASVEICANATAIAVATDGAVNASGNGVEVVQSIDSAWTSLDLSSNSLTGFQGDGANITLASLDLSSNSITNVGNITVPSTLRHLNISLNKLSEMQLPGSYQDLDSLNCSSASLSAIDVSATYLKELHAANNLLASFSSLTLASTIQVLDVSHNDLSDWAQFDPPRDLQFLNGSHNKAVALFSLNLSETDITSIDLSSNNLEQVVGIVFPTDLVSLDLRGNNIKRIELCATDYMRLSNSTTMYADSLTSPKCSSNKAAVKSVADGVSVCVLTDADFYAAYFGGSRATQSSSALDVEEEERNDNRVLAISVGVSALVGIWMIVLLIVHLRHQRKHRSGNDNENVTDVSERRLTLQPLRDQLTTTELDNDVRFEPEYASLRIDANDVMQIRTIAHGSFAVTYLVHFGDKMAVMKQLIVRRGATDRDRLIAFMEEIRVCAKLDHKNITSFYGLVWTGLEDLSSVVEYMPRGSLEVVLREQRPILKSSKSSFLWLEPSSTLPTKISLAMQVSEALVYLHSFVPAILHRNLKAENVLLGSEWEAKLMGLGYRIDVHTAGALPWAAPEVLRGGAFTEKADVYSFGAILSELDRCKRPVSRRSSRSISVESMIDAVIAKPKFRDDCPEEILKIAMSCLDEDPDKRPNAMELHFSLRQLQRHT